MDVLTQTLLPFFAVFLAVIVVHEGGHYLTAKMFGVKVLEAGIGLPPRIWGFRWRDTDYTLNALPLGAFVRMLGEEDPSDPESLAAHPKWQRGIVIGSGAFMNLVLAIALFSAAEMIPHHVSEGGAEITSVAPGSPAEGAGLQVGDQIAKVNGRTAESTSDASYLIRLHQGQTVDLTVKRRDARTGSETFVIPVYARWDPKPYTDECGIEHRQGPTGIGIGTSHGQTYALTAEERADVERQKRQDLIERRKLVKEGAPASCYGGGEFGFVPIAAGVCDDLPAEERVAAQALKAELFPQATAPCYEFQTPTGFAPFLKSRSEPVWTAVPRGIRLSFESLILTRNQVWSLIRGYESAPLAGPVGIAQVTGEVVKEAGWLPLVTLAGSISMGLAILNILPIPMLDGGRLMFIVIEFVRRGRRVAPQKEALVHLVGLAAMLALFVVITFFDIRRIFEGDSLLR